MRNFKNVIKFEKKNKRENLLAYFDFWKLYYFLFLYQIFFINEIN